MSVSFEYYKTFYYVVKYKNFTRAARVLFTSQPAITHSVQNLEHELGCRLFIRNKNGVELTREGQLLYEYVSAGCAQFFKGENELMQSISLQEGTVYLSASETALHCYLFDMLNKFRGEYQGVKMKIENSSTGRAIDELKSGVVDFAVVSTPADVVKPLKAFNLKSFRDILIAGNAFSELKNKKVNLSDIVSYPLICLAKGTQTRKLMENFYAEHNIILNPDIEPATADMVLPMVEQNLGLGYIPEEMATKAIAAGEVFQVDLQEELPERYICMVEDPTHPLSVAAREFRKKVLENL